MAAKPAHPHVVFVYGTLKTQQRFHHLMFSQGANSAQLVGAAHTMERFPLVVATPFNIPFLLYAPGKGHQVKGEVYRVDDATLDALDRLERHPTLYVRQKVNVTLTPDSSTNQGQEIECWFYALMKFKPSLLDLPAIEAYKDADYVIQEFKPDQGASLLQYVLDTDTSSSS